MRAAFYTLGCKLNQCETEGISSSFTQAGWSIVSWEKSADLYIINTCTVTSKSEQKARRIIRKILHERPGAGILVTGCYAQLNPEELRLLGKGLYIISLDNKDKLIDLPAYLSEKQREPGFSLFEALAAFLDARVKYEESTGLERFRFSAEEFRFHSRAFLKIQDGCDNRCAYCRVPLARGVSLSLPMEELLRRLRALEERGYREVVFTGVNLTQYRDPAGSLREMLLRALEKTEALRFRLSSLEPEAINPPLAGVFADPRIRPHFHIPVQSGSDRILKRMGRRYESEQVREAVNLLRNVKECPFIAADIITGFPGETDEDFLETENLFRDLRFSYGHIFPYSPREGTAAFNYKPRVPERISGERAKILKNLSDIQNRSYHENWAGRELEFLPEWTKSGIVYGTTENYIKPAVPAPPNAPAVGIWKILLETPAPPQGKFLSLM